MPSLKERRSRFQRQRALKRELRRLLKRKQQLGLEIAEQGYRADHMKDPTRRSSSRKAKFEAERQLRQVTQEIQHIQNQLEDA